MSAPFARLKEEVKDSSPVATSIVSSWEKAGGVWVRIEKTTVASCGSSPGSASWILLEPASGEGCTLLPIKAARGRAAIHGGLECLTVRPSFSATLATTPRSKLEFRRALRVLARSSAARRRRGGSIARRPERRCPSVRGSRDLVQPAPVQDPCASPACSSKPSKRPASAKVCTLIGCGCARPVLVDQQSHRTGIRLLQRRACTSTSSGPSCFQSVFELLARRILHHDGVDAAHTVMARQMHRRLAVPR